MSASDEKTRQAVVSSIFPSLFFSALGFVLAQLWVFRLHGSVSSHLLFAIPGCALMGVAAYRAKLHWIADGGVGSTITAKDIFCLLAFAGAGTAVGYVVAAGSFLGLAMAVGALYWIRWANIDVCRARFLVSSFAIFGGAVTWLGFHNVQVHPLHYLVAAWMLWMPAAIMHFLVMARLDQEDRVGQTYNPAGQQVSAEAPVPQ
jgi:hypothetical protein